jgi:hypothetical protein
MTISLKAGESARPFCYASTTAAYLGGQQERENRRHLLESHADDQAEREDESDDRFAHLAVRVLDFVLDAVELVLDPLTVRLFFRGHILCAVIHDAPCGKFVTAALQKCLSLPVDYSLRVSISGEGRA